jgi:hypothetical protein
VTSTSHTRAASIGTAAGPHHSSRNLVACAATPSALTVSAPRDIRVMRRMTTAAAARP